MGKKSRKKGANHNKKKSKKSLVSSAPPQQQQQQPPSRDETSTTNTTNKREFFVGDRVWFIGGKHPTQNQGYIKTDDFDPNTFRGYVREIRESFVSSQQLGIITFHSLIEGREDEIVWGELIVVCLI